MHSISPPPLHAGCLRTAPRHFWQTGRRAFFTLSSNGALMCDSKSFTPRLLTGTSYILAGAEAGRAGAQWAGAAVACRFELAPAGPCFVADTAAEATEWVARLQQVIGSRSRANSAPPGLRGLDLALFEATFGAETVLARLEPTTHVLHVALNRPRVLNALDGPTAARLLEVLQRAQADPAVRAVLLGGVGPALCAGGDLKAIATGAVTPADVVSALGAIVQLIHSLPVVVAVKLASGAGISLALAGMYLIAQEGPLLKNNFPVGLTIPGGGLWFAHQRGGHTAANELMLASTTPMTAARAHQLGLVNEVVPPPALMERARVVASILAAAPREPLQLSRQLVAQAASLSLPDFLAADSDVLVRVSAGRAAEAGITAFLKKTAAPDFARLDL